MLRSLPGCNNPWYKTCIQSLHPGSRCRRFTFRCMGFQMKVFAAVLTVLTGLVGVVSCGVSHSSDDTSNSTNTSLSYQYNYNGCETGEHSFSSEKDYCDGLVNESLNKGCATEIRYPEYKRRCEQYGSLESRTRSNH